MQRLTPSAAWIRFASELYAHNDISAEDAAREADQLLVEYEARFPAERAPEPDLEAADVDKPRPRLKFRSSRG